jgi:hypothetical protein
MTLIPSLRFFGRWRRRVNVGRKRSSFALFGWPWRKSRIRRSKLAGEEASLSRVSDRCVSTGAFASVFVY